MERPVDSQRIAELYDRDSRWFDAATWPAETLILGRLRRRMLRAARGDVLEIGIGSGASLPHYPGDCRLTGVDVSGGMLDRARERASRLQMDVRLVRADAERLPFPDASFDTSVSQLTLCTVPHPVVALRELRRVSRPGGRVLLLEHTTSTHPLLARGCLRCGPMLTKLAACHPNRPILDLVRQAGLQVERAERHVAGVFVLVLATAEPIPGLASGPRHDST